MMYILYEVYKLEGYYQQRKVVGIFDSEEKAEEAHQDLLAQRLMINWRDLVAYTKRHEIFNEVACDLKVQEEELRNSKPVYNHKLSGDREYNKEHTSKVSEWKAQKYAVDQKLREISHECYVKGTAYADEICVGNPPEEYAGQSVAKWKEGEEYEIVSIIVNEYTFDG